MSRQTLILDSSQLTDFGVCGMYWHLKNSELLELIPRDDVAEREDMERGTFGHKLLEIYYRRTALGATEVEAMEMSLKYRIPEGQKQISEENIKLVRKRFVDYVMKWSIGHDFHPHVRKNINHKYEKGLGTCRICDASVLDSVDCSNEPLVEMGFSYPILDTPRFLFILEGKIDLLGSQGGMKVFVDHKFQGRRHDLYEKSIQFRNYALVAGCDMGIINYIRLHKDLKDDTLVRKVITFNAAERQAWKEQLIETFHQIAARVDRGMTPRQDCNFSQCGGRFGVPCEFTQLCEESNPYLKDRLVQIKYRKKQKWHPW